MFPSHDQGSHKSKMKVQRIDNELDKTIIYPRVPNITSESYEDICWTKWKHLEFRDKKL